MLPPSVIAGVSLACAFAPWVFSASSVLRVFAAVAAATAIVGAAVMRRWDMYAGKQVADLTRARASDEWRSEERIAELEADLDESRALRGKLEQRLRAKRAELAGLRNEHAALLRRYATAETERATALEGRRLLEIEAAPVHELEAAPTDTEAGSEAGSDTASEAGTRAGAEAVAASAEAPGLFSPEGSKLFLKATTALTRLGSGAGDAEEAVESAEPAESAETVASEEAVDVVVDAEDTVDAVDAPGVKNVEESKNVEDVKNSKNVKKSKNVKDSSDSHDDDGPDGDDDGGLKAEDAPRDETVPKKDIAVRVGGPRGEPVKAGSATAEVAAERAGGAVEKGQKAQKAERVEDDPEGKPTAVDGHARATAALPARTAPKRRAGHFVAPTAVAVVPDRPERRASVEGGFDFFGTKDEGDEGGSGEGAEGPALPESSGPALDSMQNEDLADVVGREALALHKAEEESGFKPADPEARVAGQVIDLTAHDETEHIDLDGLRSAVS